MRYVFRSRQLHRQACFESIGSTRRQLRLEPLEVRQMLAASAWTNPANALDVDGDGFIVGTDALILVNRLNTKDLDNKLPPLEEGTTPDFWYDPNGDGFCTAADVLAIADRLNASNSPPLLTAALLNDTGPGGVPNNDGVTSDPTIVGSVSDAGPLVYFTASVNAFPDPVSIKNLIQPNKTFTITPAFLEELNGGDLTDGEYVLHLTAVNELGFLTLKDVTLSYDRGIFTPPAPDLTDASDTGDSQFDNITKISTPTMSVAAEPGSTVTLYVDGLPYAQQVVANPTAIFNLSQLTDGTHEFRASAVDGAGNQSGLSDPLSIKIRSSLGIEMVTVPFMDDLTPLFPVVLTSTPKVNDGTLVHIDIDRNNDGDYNDPNETDAAQSTTFNNTVNLTVTAPLLRSTTEDGYTIKVRVRTIDDAGNEAVEERSQVVNTNPSTALWDYVHKADPSYTYEVNSTFTVSQGPFSVTAYVLDMTSQTWRTDDDVNHTEWHHWVTIYVPNLTANQLNDSALLTVSGGSIGSAAPKASDPDSVLLATLAYSSRSVVVALEDVPNEPLIFTGDPDNPRSEDAIIAYSFDQFLADTTDTEWPVLVAMVKSAVKAMDTAQAYIPTVKPGLEINDFVVSGASKRGWTTWLTPAADDRIKAIIPIVFDALNLDQQMLHHYGVYGFFAEAIKDYEERNIFERILTENGSKLGAIVDPYHYFGDPNYQIPKYSVNSAGDEFFVSDSSQYYFNDEPGTQNYLRYVPNTGHGLNDDAINSVGAFYNAVINDIPLPKFTWQLGDDGSLQVNTISQVPGAVTLWQTTNPVARDFRNFNTGLTWTSTPIPSLGGGVYKADVPIPATGATAFFIELTYPTSGFVMPNVGPIPFKFTTQISVKTNLALHDWPYEVANPLGDAAPAAGSLAAASLIGDASLADALAATSFAASLPDESFAAPLATLLPAAAPLATPALSAPSQAQETARAEALAAISFSSSTTADADDDESSSALADSIFDDELFDPTGDLEELLALL